MAQVTATRPTVRELARDRQTEVTLRRFPYPYRAALAICSDIDETKTAEELLEIHRFLNTTQPTSMGEGVGLEIGNSVYFYDGKREVSYFTQGEETRSLLVDLIQAGYIDCLHSYGDVAFTRDQIERALDVLHRLDCKLDVWTNHYGSRTNVSDKFEYFFGECCGDVPGAEVYHTDITLDYGIRFAWVGASTRLVGQSPANPVPLHTRVFDPQYPRQSCINLAKEMRKKFLGRLGDERFVLLSRNQLIQPLPLRDGRTVYEFIRYCNHPVSVSRGATSRGLAYAISARALAHLKASQGYMIVYTHLGKNKDCNQVIAPESQDALRNLAREQDAGNIYVTTTSKLLNYHHACEHLEWSYQQVQGQTRIFIEALNDPVIDGWPVTPRQLQGLTFYVPDRNAAAIYLQGVELTTLQRNPADHTGTESVSIPLSRLSFPY